MEPEIIKKGSFSIAGFEIRTTIKDGRNYQEIPAFWGKVMKESKLEAIPNKADPKVCLGICTDFNTEDQTFIYIIGAEVTSKENLPEGMITREIPEAEYAVFTAKGEMPKCIQETFIQIFRDWLPKSGYKHSGSPEFEYYDDRCCKDPAEVDIYIPIVKAE